MKANAPKRKVFADAMDLLTENAPVAENDIQMIAVDAIRPFRNHPFRLYEGERLQEMVDSIREHGVLMPAIVLQTDDGYEMLAGHNRQNAARIAGLDKIPAIVKKDLTEEEVYVYVIETNVIQRSFSELLPSEKGEVLTERYEKVVCQGKRNDILQEIARLEGKEISCGHDVHKRTRDNIGEEYGMVGRNAARYLRVHYLNDDLKIMFDTGKLTLVAGMEISFLNEEEQALVYKALQVDGIKADLDNARKLRGQSGNLTMDSIMDILTKGKGKKTSYSAKRAVYIKEKYFKEKEPEQMREIMELALERYFEKETMDV